MKKAMTLGEIISALQRKDQEAEISFDFVYFVPDGIHSWRGDYSEIAVGYKKGEPPNVSDILKMFEDAIGEEFTGHKGGTYFMDESTVVHVANSDESGDTVIVDVTEDSYQVTLVTARVHS